MKPTALMYAGGIENDRSTRSRPASGKPEAQRGIAQEAEDSSGLAYQTCGRRSFRCPQALVVRTRTLRLSGRGSLGLMRLGR